MGGAISYALGLPAEDIAPAKVNLLRLWGTLGLTIVLLLGSAFSIRNLLTIKPDAIGRSTVVNAILAIVPSLALLGLSYFLAVSVPHFSGVNLTAVYMFYPDVGVLMLSSSIIAALWAVSRLWLLINRRKPSA